MKSEGTNLVGRTTVLLVVRFQPAHKVPIALRRILPPELCEKEFEKVAELWVIVVRLKLRQDDVPMPSGNTVEELVRWLKEAGHVS